MITIKIKICNSQEEAIWALDQTGQEKVQWLLPRVHQHGERDTPAAVLDPRVDHNDERSGEDDQRVSFRVDQVGAQSVELPRRSDDLRRSACQKGSRTEHQIEQNHWATGPDRDWGVVRQGDAGSWSHAHRSD